jgi:TfoX/Sxy family transcriptional regulator of competence genes
LIGRSGQVERTKAEQAFERVVERLSSEAGVTTGTGFGSNPGLRVGGRIFAMLSRGELVVKLPRDRVDELVESGTGERFDAGKGRPMKEWLAVPARRSRAWQGLSAEAFEFVRPARPSRRKR